jgi:hypothetical protein
MNPAHGIEDVSGKLPRRLRASFGEVGVRGLEVQIGEA